MMRVIYHADDFAHLIAGDGAQWGVLFHGPEVTHDGVTRPVSVMVDLPTVYKDSFVVARDLPSIEAAVRRLLDGLRAAKVE